MLAVVHPKDLADNVRITSLPLPVLMTDQQYRSRVRLLVRGSKIPAERRRHAEHPEEAGGNHARTHALGVTLAEKSKDHAVVLGEFLKGTVPPTVVVDLGNRELHLSD